MFDCKDFLIAHLQEQHRIDIHRDWNCEKCHEIFSSKDNVEKHECPVHSNSFTGNKNECRYYRQGKWCPYQARCRFTHGQQSSGDGQQSSGGGQQSSGGAQKRSRGAQQRSGAQQGPRGDQQRSEFTEACWRGRECGYLASGCCNFFHPGVGVQVPRQGCRWQERCRDQETCPYTHAVFGMTRNLQENY